MSYLENSCVNRVANFLKKSRESLFVFYVCRCLSAHHVQAVPEEGVRCLETEITGGCESPCRCLE